MKLSKEELSFLVELVDDEIQQTEKHYSKDKGIPEALAKIRELNEKLQRELAGAGEGSRDA